MNRRSLLRMLGLAPVALALPAAPALPPVDYKGFTADVQDRIEGCLRVEAFARAEADAAMARQIEVTTSDLRSAFSFDGERLHIPSLTIPKGVPV